MLGSSGGVYMCTRYISWSHVPPSADQPSIFCIFSYRSDGFRKGYGRFGEFRALLPPPVHVMALTATATAPSCVKTIDSLRMYNPQVISKPLHKKNIFYSVHLKGSVEDLVDLLLDCWQRFRASMPRTIVFCRHY